MEKNVLIIQRRMTEYRVPMFEALKARLARDGVTLQVVYGPPAAVEALRNDAGVLPWGMKVPCRYLGSGKFQLIWQSIPRRFIEEQDLIIIPHENMLLLNHLLLFQRWRLGQAKLAFWGHGANFQSREKKSIRERFKSWTARQPDWWFAYTALSVQEVMASGFPAERITCLNNAVDVGSLQKWREGITTEEREALLQELGLQGTRLAVFLGGLYQEKRLDFLFAATDELRRRLPDFELLIIGNGPQCGLVREFAASRPWCSWIGARHGREKALHVSLGQVMLNPGLVGLSILDSFALGVPLLTTDCGIHSPEIAYLESGRNGFMTANDLREYANTATKLLTDTDSRHMLARNCARDAERYSLGNMVNNFRTGILNALDRGTAKDLPGKHVVIIWQRFLPYHHARIRRARQRLASLGCRLTAIEVANQDASYGFTDEAGDFERVTCFPGTSYHRHSAREIHRKVLLILTSLQPDIVFAPATAFPEGMAADAHRLASGCTRVMMDDAWEHTDQRGWLTRRMKRLIHRNIDGVFIPAPSHLPYYEKLGFPPERALFGVDVVDNGYFSSRADSARLNAPAIRADKGLPGKYLLFVGRFLPRKGLETLLTAYGRYREQPGHEVWDLVLVGGGAHQKSIQALSAGMPGVHFAGVVTGDELCLYCGLAQALVVPSVRDQWGLVVNEGLASGLPALVSRGCGAASTLIREGDNGWTFDPGDVDTLAGLMVRMSALTSETLKRMGERSREIIAGCSLEDFADGVVHALALPRRHSGGILADLATRLWKGRVSIT